MRRPLALALLGWLWIGSSVSTAQDGPDASIVQAPAAEALEGDAATQDDTAPRSTPPGELATPRPVYIGMYLFHVPSLDLDTNSYLVDFYLWFRWQGDDIDPSTTFEFMNAVEAWDTQRVPIYTDDDDEPLPDDLGDGWRYQAFHVQGRFGHAFDIRAYPFDSQELVIHVEDTNAVVEDMVYVADEGTHVVHPGLEIPGWTLGRVEASVSEQDYPTNFGDTRRPIGADRYSHFRYSVRVERPVLGYAVTTILPIAIVMLITMIMFLIESKYFEGRLGLGITSLISAVALQLTSDGDLPSNGYLVLLDHVYNLSYLVIFLSLLASVASVRIYDAGFELRARRFDRVMMAVLILVFFGGTGVLIALGR